MRTFKPFALLTALAMSGAAFAVDPSDSTTVTLTNTAPDTIVADSSANMEEGGKTGTSSLSWTTAAASTGNRKIVASVLADDFKTNVNSLSVVAGTIRLNNGLRGTGAAGAVVLQKILQAAMRAFANDVSVDQGVA